MTTAPGAPQTTPTETTSPTPTIEPLDTSLLSGDDSELSDGDDFDMASLHAKESPAPAVTPSPSPAVTVAPGAPQQPGPVSTPAPAAVVAPTVAPALASAATPPVAPATPPVSETPEQIQHRYMEHRNGQLQKLAESTFKLDDATVAAISENPGEVIPMLMAQATMASIEASVVAIANMLPGVIQSVTQRQNEYAEGESDFYKAWPALKDIPKEQKASLEQIGALYRHLNPTAPKEDFIKIVGANACAALGIQVAQPQPSAPIAPAVPRQAPHSPIASSAPRIPGSSAVSENRFTALADDDLANGFN